METLINIPNKQKVAVMAAVMLSMFLAALDQTIVSTAMPIIVSEFNALEHISWVFTAYMLTSTISVPIYGKLSDMYGRKGFYLLSIVIFLAGSALCGFAQNMTQLIIFRAIQGIGGGALMTNSFAIIADLFEPQQRGKWMGFMGAVFGLSSVFGPTMGGWLTDNLSWRWVFYVNLPLGVAAIIAVMILMPIIKSTVRDKTIDYMGAIYIAIGLTCLLLGFSWAGSEFAWGSIQIIFLFVSAFIFLFLFGWVERFAKNPILPLSLFKNETFTVSIILTFIMAMGMFGVISYIPLFAQKVIGISATDSGTVMFPMMFGMIGSSIISGNIISRTGKYKFLAIIGVFIAVIALFFLSQMGESTTKFQLIIRMVGMGIGLGLTTPVFNIAIQNAFDHSKIGIVTASTQLFRSVGGTVGVALAGGILNIVMKNEGNLAEGISSVFFFGMFFMIGAFIISLFLKEIPMPKRKEKLEDIGIELAQEEGDFASEHEPGKLNRR